MTAECVCETLADGRIDTCCFHGDNVVPLVQPLDLQTITDMIAEITGPNTTGIALIASTDDDVKVRTFGDKQAIAQDVKAAAEALGGET